MSTESFFERLQRKRAELKTVESGTINPPEAPETAPAEPPSEQSAGQPDKAAYALETMGREALKTLAIQAGLVTASSKSSEKTLRETLRAYGYGSSSPAPAAVPESVTESSAPKAEPAPHARPVGTLYVGCLPSGGAADVATLVADVHAEFAAAANVPHYALVEYGKGAGMIAALLESRLTAAPCARLFADRFTHAQILETLVRLSAEVVRTC